MEIRFCSICNESIPDGEFDAGRAITSGKRSQHVACALKRSVELNGARSWLTSLLALYAAGIATFLLVSTLGRSEPEPEEPKVEAIVEERIQDVADARDAQIVALLDKRLESTRAAVRKDVSDDLVAAWEKRVSEDLRGLDGRIGRDLTTIHESISTMNKRMAATEEVTNRNSEWFQKIQEQANDLETRLVQAAEQRRKEEAEAEKATPAVADAPDDANRGVDAEHEAKLERWIKALKDADEEIVFTATLELGQLKDLRATQPLLVVMKKHRDFYARLGAATALGEIQAVDAFLPLVDALVSDKEKLVQTAAADAMMKISGKDFEFVSGLTKAERRRIQNRAKQWFKEHEAELRQKLNQPAE